MKKPHLKKLQLHKIRISALEQRAIRGGNNFTTDCETFQVTICQTRCNGEEACQLYFTRGFDCDR